jgi:hypothetical protein
MDPDGGSIRQIAHPFGDDLLYMIQAAVDGDLISLEEGDMDGYFLHRPFVGIERVHKAGTAFAFGEGRCGNEGIGRADGGCNRSVQKRPGASLWPGG